MSDIKLAPGITPAGKSFTPTVWNILGHTYYEKSNSATSFSFETFDPPGTSVPPHIHPTQDEFIYMLEGKLELMLDHKDFVANAGDLVRMPMGIPHAIYYPVPLHLQKAFAMSGYHEGDFPVTEQACREVVSLPMHTELTDEQQQFVCTTIREYYAGR